MDLRLISQAAIAMAVQLSASAQTLRIDLVTINNNELAADVMYGGGCKRHSFEFDVRNEFQDSHEVQAKGEILHNSNNDTCERAITTTLRFDISGVIDDYKQFSQRQHGSFQLELKGYGPVNVTF